MSLIDTSNQGIAALALGVGATALNIALPGSNYRMIGGIVAQCNIAERHYDTITKTYHPVEYGAPISDHAFKNPRVVDIVVGYSNQFDSMFTLYQKFLKLQADLVPFDIITGKRAYNNMLLMAISVITDSDSENILVLELTCEEVLIVSTQVINTAKNPVNAQDNSRLTNAGNVQTFPLPDLSPIQHYPLAS